MAANSSEVTKPTNVSDISDARSAQRQSESSDEKRMTAAVEQIADCVEAIRQDMVNFQTLIERFIIWQKIP